LNAVSKVFFGRLVPQLRPEVPRVEPSAEPLLVPVITPAKIVEAVKETKTRRRLRAERAAIIPRCYEGKTAVCFASGPSLTHDVVERIRPYHEAGRVVACGLNDTYRIVDYLDEFYACDTSWWDYHIAHDHEGRNVLTQKARIWGNTTAELSLQAHDINIVEGSSARGFSDNPRVIHWGSNSGYQLLNLVWLMGVKRILLVGYNMQVPNKLGEKAHHFFGPHPKPMSQAGSYQGFVRNYQTIQLDIRKCIINCTPDSALDCFHEADLQTELDLT